MAEAEGLKRTGVQAVHAAGLESRTRLLAEGGDDEGTVKEVVEALARRLGDEQAAVAGGAFQKSFDVVGAWRVSARTPGRWRAQVAADTLVLPRQAAESAPGTDGAGREQDAGHRVVVVGRAVEALADRRRGVAAAQRDGLDQEMK